MSTETKFSQAEREAIDAADAALRKLVPPPDRAEAGFPYAHHHRVARNQLREALRRRAPTRHRQSAGLLLEWARENGDIRLYVYRPYAVWVEHNGPSTTDPAWDEVKHSLASARPFEEFVARQARET